MVRPASRWAPRPHSGVAGFPWNQWQLCYGISGNFRVEQVAALAWNRWQASPGIGGSFRVEYAHQARVLGPPVVGLPFEPDIVLLRQHHYLLGKGRGALAVDRCKLRGGDGLWLSTFHELCYNSFFWKVPFF